MWPLQRIGNQIDKQCCGSGSRPGPFVVKKRKIFTSRKKMLTKTQSFVGFSSYAFFREVLAPGGQLPVPQKELLPSASIMKFLVLSIHFRAYFCLAFFDLNRSIS
jgi:hypothetical protein